MDNIGLKPLIIGNLPINLYMNNLIYILVIDNMKKKLLQQRSLELKNKSKQYIERKYVNNCKKWRGKND